MSTTLKAVTTRPNQEPIITIQREAAAETFDWLVRERAYQVQKFGIEQDDKHTLSEAEEGWWKHQFDMYLARSATLTLENPLGRQAFAKFVATTCGALESIIRIYGPLPTPGVPSGNQDGKVAV